MIGSRVFPDGNRIGRPKAVTLIPILLGYYRQLPHYLASESVGDTVGLDVDPASGMGPVEHLTGEGGAPVKFQGGDSGRRSLTINHVRRMTLIAEREGTMGCLLH